MPRMVRFDKYGDEDVLYIADVAIPDPDDQQVVVRVRAAGVNTGEVGIRSGAMDKVSPAHFPEGQGSELAGVIHTVGAGVDGFSAGDPVIGLSDERNAQSDYAVVPAKNILAKPDSLDWDTAAATPTAGATATSIMQTLQPQRGETLVVAGVGGVGVVTVQMALQVGARVIATASESNHEYLRKLGAEPVAYGDGLEGRIRAVARDGVDAFADCYGGGNVDVAVALGVPAKRINTIKDFDAAKRIGANAQGLYQLKDITAALKPFVAKVAAGDIEIPIKARFPMEQVQDAYRRLTQPGGIGKVILDISTDD